MIDGAAATGEERDYPGRLYAWGVVAILVATAVLSYTDRQVLSLLVDPIRRDLGIGDVEVSLLLGSAFAVIYGVAGIPFGWLADRVSRRNLIFAGVLVWGIGTIACGYAGTFHELFAARLIVGLGESVLSPAAISLISDYFPPARRGFAVGAFLSGIAIGQGAAILIGGAALHFVQAGTLAGTPLAGVAPWRLVLLVIGAPALVWSLAIFLIREPDRRGAVPGVKEIGSGEGVLAVLWGEMTPIYIVLAAGSLVDNAVGAWAPTLLIRDFHLNAAYVGLALGTRLVIGFGAGVLAGGWLSDMAGRGGHFSRKLLVCLATSALILPVCWGIDGSSESLVMLAVPAYFLLSGPVTACGFSALLDVVPGERRGLAMAVSFFLNVAVGAGLGPTLVALFGAHVFGTGAGLGAPIALTATVGYGLDAILLAVTVAALRRRPVAPV
ncbi:MAG: MFS transporter [Steroidobacterales bacterium]